MNISISDLLFERIKKKVESGGYPSSDAVIAKALELLDQHEATLAHDLDDVQSKVRDGLTALRDGD